MVSINSQEKAALTNRNGDELFNLGRNYYAGKGGIARDPVKASALLQLSGKPDARSILGDLASEMSPPEKTEAAKTAREWYQQFNFGNHA